MKPPIKGMPTEVNRRLDELDRKTQRETIIKTIREGPVLGSSSYPTVSLEENITLGAWTATDTSIKLRAEPTGEFMYEFGIQQVGEESWDCKITKETTAVFSGLRPETSYNCKVRVIDFDGGTSPWSTITVVTTTKDITPPIVPEGLSLVADSYYVRAKVNEITLEDCPDFDGFEWHGSTQAGFTPGDSTFRGSGRGTRIVFHAPDAGITWYVKVRSYDVNGNYSDYCAEASVVVPVPKVPTVPADPTDQGELVIREGIVEIDDCDTLGNWESEAPNAIRLSAAEGGEVKEGTGALKIEIDKYGRVLNQVIGDEIYGIGSAQFTKYVGQRYKALTNDSLKRIGAQIYKIGAPPALSCFVYSDLDGSPSVLLGTATVDGITTAPNWRYATLATAVPQVNEAYYWIIYSWGNISPSEYYKIYLSSDNPYGGTECHVEAGENWGLGDYVHTQCDFAFRLYSDEVSLHNHFKISDLGVTDLTGCNSIEFWVKGSEGENILQASMGEAALGEKTNAVTIPLAYQTHVWDISGIVPGDKDAIAHFGFKVMLPDDTETITLYLDYIRSPKEKRIKVKISDDLICLWPQLPRGYRNGCRPEWGSVNNCAITPGSIEIDGYGAYLGSPITVGWPDLETGAEAASTWYYFYLVKPIVDGGMPTAKISVTPPSAGLQGRYHPSQPTWRCVGSFYNDAGSDIKKAYYHNDGWTYWDVHVQDLTAGTAVARTAVTMFISSISEKISVEAHCSGNTNQIRYAKIYLTLSGGDFQMNLITTGDAAYRIRTRSRGTLPIAIPSTLHYICETNAVELDLYTHGYWEDL